MCVHHSTFVAFFYSALGLWFVVQRSKQCTDFAASMHILHLFFCWIYNHQFPGTFAWWLMNIGCVALTTVLGEFLCMRTEMKSIPLLDGKSRADLWRMRCILFPRKSFLCLDGWCNLFSNGLHRRTSNRKSPKKLKTFQEVEKVLLRRQHTGDKDSLITWEPVGMVRMNSCVRDILRKTVWQQEIRQHLCTNGTSFTSNMGDGGLWGIRQGYPLYMHWSFLCTCWMLWHNKIDQDSLGTEDNFNSTSHIEICL